MSVLPHEGTFPVLYGSYGIPVGSGFRRGYLARPDQAGLFPVVIVVPGAQGLSASHRDLCRRLARRGFATLALDRAAGHGPSEHDVNEACEFVMSADINWAIGGHLGLVGTREGASPALGYAAGRRSVGAVVVVEPLLDDGAGLLERVASPVIGFFGADDGEAATLPGASTIRWILYEAAGRGFFDDGAPGYHPAAAADALDRMVAFLEGGLPAAQLERLG